MQKTLRGASVLIVHVIPNSSGGGAELLVRELVSRQPMVYRNLQAHAIFYVREFRDSLELKEHSLAMRNPRSPRAISRLRRELKKLIGNAAPKALVVVHLHLTWGLIYGVLACRGLPVKVVYTEHNTSNKWRGIPGARFIFSELYGRLDRIICISAGVRQSLDVWLNRRGRKAPRIVVMNGARLLGLPAKARQEMVGRGLRLVAVGSLNRRKGFDVLLRAVAQSLELVESLIIVGEGPEYSRLSSLSSELGIADVCRFVGWQNDVESWYHGADCMVMSSRWEGFGLVAVEAMSTGLPVVAPRLPGLAEVLSNTRAAFLFEPESEDALAAALAIVHEALQSDAQLLGALASSHAAHFSLDRMAEQYVAVYRGLES